MDFLPHIALGGNPLDPASRLALQLGVHDRLDPVPADRLVRRPVACQVLVLVVGLADIAEDVGRECAVGVLARRVLRDQNTRHPGIAFLEIGHGGEIEVPHIMVGQVGIGAEVLPYFFLIKRRGEVEGVLDRLDAAPDDLDDIVLGTRFALLGGAQMKPGHVALVALGIGAAQVAEIKVDVEAGPVFRQHDAVAVADGSAGGRDALADGRLLLRPRAGRARIDDLHVPEPAQEHADGGKDQQRQHTQPPALDAAIVSEHTSFPGVRGPASIRRGGEAGRSGKRTRGRGAGSGGRRK